MAWMRNSIEDIEKLSRQLRFKAKKKAAIDQLCAAFEPLVQSFVPKYLQKLPGAEREELEQVARLGLLEACHTFDRRKGAFVTHAQWSIRGALARYSGKLENPVRLPYTLTFYLPKLRRAMVKLGHELGREPTIGELAKAVGKTEVAVRELLAYDAGPMHLNRGELVDDLTTAMSPEDELILREEMAALAVIVKRRKRRRT
jgi:DNA-directed RNA polymerase specialized sigma subunit